MENFIKKASVLIEAIPYINAFRRKVFVIKYGGSILDDPKIRHAVLEDIVFLSYVGIRTILVHGGGPHISNRMKKAGLKSEFHDGVRITDKETLQIVNEELDKLNKQIVKEVKDLKGDVIGLCGDENIVRVEKKRATKDLGFVGSVISINKEVLENLFQPFYTRSQNGTGVGLSLCKNIMEGFGGGISCEAVEGEYSAFLLSFPRI